MPNNQNLAVAARNVLLSGASVYNFSIEATGSGVNASFLKNSICFPGPCTIAPTFSFPGNGLYIPVANATEYAAAIANKVSIVTNQVPEPGMIIIRGLGIAGIAMRRLILKKDPSFSQRPRDLPIPGADLMITSDEVLKAEAERIGITVKTGVSVNEISWADGRLQVAYAHDGQDLIVTADRVVHGAGHIANGDALDLDAGNIAHDGVSIDVDEYLRSTSNPAVWVVGDALTISPQLSPVATYEGRIVGRNVVDGPSIMTDYLALPASVYTIPAYSFVGLTEEQARADNTNLRVTVNDMTTWFSGKSYGETAAWAKVLVDDDTDRIVGAHIVGHNGEDLINLFVLAMRNDIPAAGLKDTILTYPTFSSDVKNMF